MTLKMALLWITCVVSWLCTLFVLVLPVELLYVHYSVLKRIFFLLLLLSVSQLNLVWAESILATGVNELVQTLLKCTFDVFCGSVNTGMFLMDFFSKIEKKKILENTLIHLHLILVNVHSLTGNELDNSLAVHCSISILSRLIQSF